MRNKWKKIVVLLAVGSAMWTIGNGQMAAYGQTSSQKDHKEDLKKDGKDMYGIGSTSKVVAAAAVMKLSEEGKISLDQPLTLYIPEFQMKDERYQKITPRMLLDHTSGLQGSSLKGSMLLGDNDTYNHDMLLEFLKDQRLKADPGEFGVYCNDGFTLAEILVERVSGLSFTEYIKQEFADPLGLNWFQTPQSEGVQEHLAAIYDKSSGKALPPDTGNVIGSGGIYATAEDLVTFSQIFMRDQKDAAGIISPDTAKKMEYSSYEKEYNPQGRDSKLSYGLGWDSVNSYPFSQYGVKALVKGGDVSFYHSSLTVLPEENISCAVLTSGGSSAVNQLAVQEILLTYLEETDRIERKDESGFKMEAEIEMPKDLKDWSGWYAGRGMMYLDISDQGELTLSQKDLEHERTQIYRYGGEGLFYSTGSDYIDTTGELTKGSNGRIGSSVLEFHTGPNGNKYLMAGMSEWYPRLGRTTDYLPLAQKLEPESPKEGVTEAWKDRCGKEYYLVDEKYSSAMYLTHPVIKPMVLDNPAGYLAFKDQELSLARLTDSTHGEFFQKIPGQAGRDLSDYKITAKDGKVYLESTNYRYVAEDDLNLLPREGQTITIGEDGESIWFLLTKDLNLGSLSIDVPENGAWYAYHHTGKELKSVSNSWIMEKGQEFLLPLEGRIVFAGEPGTTFTIRCAQ